MKKECRQNGWATVTVAADFFGLTTQAIRQTYITKLSEEDVDRSARPMRVRVAAVVELMVQQRVADLAREDPFLEEAGTSDSPGLERYRIARAMLAEDELEKRRGQLIEAEKARHIFSRWGTVIRRMGERLTKRFGNEAHDIVADAIEQCRDVAREVCE